LDQRLSTRRPFVLVLCVVCIALVAIAATPSTAYAWTPGTHIFLGEAIIRSLSLLPGPIAEIIAAFPYDFLYGNIAADTEQGYRHPSDDDGRYA
jgi:hypothetical protein